MIVVDTTVLVYAVGSEHAYREPSRSLIEAVRAGDIQATTTIEVIQEFAHVRARRRGRDDARRLAAAYADLLAPLRTTSELNLRSGLEQWARSERLGAFDAVLAEVARDLGALAVVSADRAFEDVDGVRHVIPDASGVAHLLAAPP